MFLRCESRNAETRRRDKALNGKIGGMTKGGYQKLLHRFQEKENENTRLQREIEERDKKISKLESVPTASHAADRQSKVFEFWSSTPVWGAFGVLTGVILSRVTSRVALENLTAATIFIGFWIVICIEFVRLRAVENRFGRYVANAAFAVTLGMCLVVGWRFLPKTQSEPDVADSVVNEIRSIAPWLFERPAENLPAAGKDKQISSNQIEVYFGGPESSRGTEVHFASAQQERQLFLDGGKGGKFDTRLFPEYSGQRVQQIQILVRNVSESALLNGSVTITSDRMIEPVTTGARLGKGFALIYDFSELRPYADGAQELAIVVQISTKSSAYDPTPLLVTITGQGLRSPHSEIMEFAFMPLPS